jgi:hypothetical protein
MTETENIVRKKLIRRINQLSRDKINALENYLNKMESSKSSKDEILSYAGIFEELDSDFFIEITDDLHLNRKSGRTRIR